MRAAESAGSTRIELTFERLGPLQLLASRSRPSLAARVALRVDVAGHAAVRYRHGFGYVHIRHLAACWFGLLCSQHGPWLQVGLGVARFREDRVGFEWFRELLSVHGRSSNLDGADVMEPLATESLGVVLATTGEPQVQLLHVLERHFVKQVIIGLARRSEGF